MPDIEFACPSCGQTLEAPLEMAGESVECPSCQEVMVVPQADQEDASLQDVSFAGGAGTSVEDVLSQADNELPDEDDGSCPECGADMEPDAVLCIQCGFHKGLGRRMSTEIE